MMREHILLTIAERRVFNAEQYTDAKSVCSCEPDDLISRVAGLVAGIDAMRTRLAEAEAVVAASIAYFAGRSSGDLDAGLTALGDMEDAVINWRVKRAAEAARGKE